MAPHFKEESQAYITLPFVCLFSFFFFYFIFKLYNIVLVLPNIEIILLFDILASILGFLKLPGGLLVE